MVWATACTPDKYREIGAPSEPLASLTGTWKLDKVVQKDEQAEVKNSPFVSEDITNLFNYKTLTIKLNTNAGVPADYLVTPGTAPTIITSSSGKWLVDDVKAPTKIWFVNGTDTTVMQIGSYPRSFNQGFQMRVMKYEQPSKLAVSYTYDFIKQ